MKRKFWFFALALVPIVLAIPLWVAASWKPHRLGVHPIQGKSLPPFVSGMLPVPPQFDLMMAPDGAHILSISSECNPAGLAMWDVDRRHILWKKAQEKFRNWSPLCFSPDSKFLAMASNPDFNAPFSAKGNPALAIFDVTDGKQIAILPVRDRDFYVMGAFFLRDGKHLIAASNQEVRTWDVTTRRETSRVVLIGEQSNESSAVTLAPGGARFIVNWDFLGSTNTPRHLGAEMRDSNNRVGWKMPAGNGPHFAFSPDAKSLLVSDQSSVFEMRDAKTGRVRWKKSIINAGFNARDWLSDSSAIVVDIHDKFEIWDAQTGKITRSIAHGQLQNFVISPDNAQLYSVDFGGQIWRQRLR